MALDLQVTGSIPGRGATTFRANRPLDLPEPRPDYARSTNRVPMQVSGRCRCGRD